MTEVTIRFFMKLTDDTIERFEGLVLNTGEKITGRVSSGFWFKTSRSPIAILTDIEAAGWDLDADFDQIEFCYH